MSDSTATDATPATAPATSSTATADTTSSAHDFVTRAELRLVVQALIAGGNLHEAGERELRALMGEQA